jgi:short-subunit dehydrogenase
MRITQAQVVPPFRRPLALLTDVSNLLELALAEQFVAAGHDLIIVSDDPQRLVRVAEQLRSIGDGPVIETIEADLTMPGSARHIHELAGEIGQLDVLVNNATAASELTVVELTRLVADDMVKAGRGKILFTFEGTGEAAAESAWGDSRSNLHAYAEALGQNLEETGVTVTAMSSADETALPRAVVRRVARAGYQALLRGEPTAQRSMRG